RVRPKLLPVDAISAARNAEPLPSGAILAQVVHVQRIANAQYIGVRHTALVPASSRASVENGRGTLCPLATVKGPCQADFGGPTQAGLIPVKEFVSIEQSGSVGGNVAFFPGVRLRRENAPLLSPIHPVERDGEAGVPGLAVEARVEIIVLAIAPQYRGIED